MMDSKIKIDSCSADCDGDELICLPDTELPRVVIIGAGFAGLALVKKLKDQKIQVVLIDRNNFHQFQPLLYQVATSGLEPDSILFPIRKQLSGYKNVVFRMAEVTEIQTSHNLIITDKGRLNYNYLVLATGAEINYFGLNQFQKQSLGLKDIRDALDIRHKMLLNLEQAAISCDPQQRDALTNFVIVGGGPAGVEMAGALGEFCRYILPKDYPEFSSSLMKIYLLEASNQLLSGMSGKASIKTLEYLQTLNVHVLLNETVTDYDGTVISTHQGSDILTKNVIWTAGVKGQFPMGLATQANTTKGNRLRVDEFMRMDGTENVFVLGDVAAMITRETPNGHPQVAQPAIQQGKYLAKMLINIIHARPIQPFKYIDKGSLATVGKSKAVADIGKWSFAGYIAWLLWSLVHIMSISGFRNRMLVGINWILNYFSYEKSNRLIIRASTKTNDSDN